MVWLTTKEAAHLEQVEQRTIRRNIDNYDYRCINGVGGRNGTRYLISLDSLSPAAQSRYHHQTVTEPQDKAAAELAALTEASRNDVFFKLGVVRRYQEFKETYPKVDKMVAFLRMYNEEHTERPLSRRQLNHWETLYNREGVTGLIDRRGTWNKGVSSIPEEVAEVFRAYWMQEKGTRKGGPSVESCYRLTQLNFPGVELPSVSTFARYAQSIPYLSKVLAREGDKAFKDKCEPYMPFDYRSICTNELWTADNHVFDLWVKDETGRVFRPWIIGWMDKRSRYIVGYLLIDHDPNSDAVADAFSRAVHACGSKKAQAVPSDAKVIPHRVRAVEARAVHPARAVVSGAFHQQLVKGDIEG